MDELHLEFKSESLGLLDQMSELLEYVEEHPAERNQMEVFGQLVDRIMGGAKSLALSLPKEHVLHFVGSFGEICKILGYKSSQLVEKDELFNVTLAFLFDAVEALRRLIDKIGAEDVLEAHMKSSEHTFLDRLRWIATQFDENIRSTTALRNPDKPSKGVATTESQIKDLLAELGVQYVKHD